MNSVLWYKKCTYKEYNQKSPPIHIKYKRWCSLRWCLLSIKSRLIFWYFQSKISQSRPKVLLHIGFVVYQCVSSNQLSSVDSKCYCTITMMFCLHQLCGMLCSVIEAITHTVSYSNLNKPQMKSLSSAVDSSTGICYTNWSKYNLSKGQLLPVNHLRFQSTFI